MNIVAAVQNRLNIETATERREWDAREELIRNTVDVSYFNKGFQQQLSQEVDALSGIGSAHRGALEIIAEERVRLRALCAARCALPAAGLGAEELRDMGFSTGRRDRVFGILRLVSFPEGWLIEPAQPQPALQESSHAVVFDSAGTERLRLLYRNSIANDTIKGHTYLAS